MNNQTLEQAADDVTSKLCGKYMDKPTRIANFMLGAEWKESEMKEDCIKQQIELLESVFDTDNDTMTIVIVKLQRKLAELKAKLK